MPTIKQLRYLDAVARFNHFGKAADHCAVTQPALSMQIQDLERTLGLQLVERRAKGVSLTDAGRDIARRASRILAETRDLRDYARHRGSVLSGALHLGVIPSVAPYVLPQLMPPLRETYPDLDLHIRETQTGTLVQQLLDGSLDLLFLALPVEAASVETLALFEDRFWLAMPGARRLSTAVRATAEHMQHDRLLLLEEGHCLRDQALAVCQLRQVENIDTFGASSLSTLVQMVANGLGLTLLPEISLALETRRGDIHVMEFEDPQPVRTLGLAWRTTSPRKAEFKALGELIKSTVGPAAPQPRAGRTRSSSARLETTASAPRSRTGIRE
jgi:LysR family transcriptional regulator, hydrogen peroxide-inducible genes activator